MHPALRVPELLRLVFDELDSPDIRQLPLTCRHFWNASIPLLWKTTSAELHTEDVLRIFPAVDSEEDMTNKHMIQASLYTRLRYYGRCIRHFTVKMPGTRDKSFVELLHSKPVAAIFPGLQYLTFELSDWGSDTSEILRQSLRGPRLEHVFFYLRQFTDLGEVVPSIASELNGHHLNIRSFALIQMDETRRYSPIRSSEQDQLCQLLGSLLRLEDLELVNLGGESELFWEASSRLPKLEEVIIQTGRLASTHPDLTLSPGFPSVRCVEFENIAPRHVPTICRSITSTRLEELYVTGVKEEWAVPELVSRAFDGIQRFGELTTFCVKLYNATVEWEDLVPLLSCPTLETVTMEVQHIAAVVTDQRLSAMARAWPLLRILALFDPLLGLSPDGEEIIPAATLKGLACLAVYTPCLESLRISVDARGVWKQGPHPLVGTEVREVGLGYSVTDGTAGMVEIANFISEMWPQQERIEDGIFWEDAVNGTQFTRWCTIWGWVRDRLSASRDLVINSF